MNAILKPILAILLTTVIATESNEFLKQTIFEDTPSEKKRKQQETETESLFKRNTSMVLRKLHLGSIAASLRLIQSWALFKKNVKCKCHM